MVLRNGPLVVSILNCQGRFVYRRLVSSVDYSRGYSLTYSSEGNREDWLNRIDLPSDEKHFGLYSDYSSRHTNRQTKCNQQYIMRSIG